MHRRGHGRVSPVGCCILGTPLESHGKRHDARRHRSIGGSRRLMWEMTDLHSQPLSQAPYVFGSQVFLLRCQVQQPGGGGKGLPLIGEWSTTAGLPGTWGAAAGKSKTAGPRGVKREAATPTGWGGSDYVATGWWGEDESDRAGRCDPRRGESKTTGPDRGSVWLTCGSAWG